MIDVKVYDLNGLGTLHGTAHSLEGLVGLFNVAAGNLNGASLHGTCRETTLSGEMHRVDFDQFIERQRRYEQAPQGWDSV